MTTCNNYYCDTCEKEVETEVREITEEFEVKDEKITATIKIRICKICGEEVWDEELEKQNEKIVYSMYRKKKGLLQPEEIKLIREKYHLSQALFARLLGFGEKTITRYERGALQDMAHDILIRLMDEEKNIKTAYEAHKTLFNEKEQQALDKILYKNMVLLPFPSGTSANKDKYTGKFNLA